MEGDIGFNDFLGTADDLMRNLDGVSRVAGLTDKERKALKAEARLTRRAC
jgi:hypothetical protein